MLGVPTGMGSFDFVRLRLTSLRMTWTVGMTKIGEFPPRVKVVRFPKTSRLHALSLRLAAIAARDMPGRMLSTVLR
jgi:hypothetical protein